MGIFSFVVPSEIMAKDEIVLTFTICPILFRIKYEASCENIHEFKKEQGS